MTSLFDTWTHDPVSWQGGTYNDFFALEFGVNSPVHVTALRYWYVPAVGNKPDALALYDLTASVSLGNITSVGAPLAAGWNDYALPAPVDLVAGHTYQIGYDPPWNQSVPYTNTATVPPSALVFGVNGWRDSAASWNPVGGGITDTTVRLLVDISGTVTQSGGGGLTNADLQAELAAWLSANGSTNGHQADGLPWISKQSLDAIGTNVGTVLDKIGNVSSQEQTQYGISGNNLWRGLIALLAYVVANGQNLQALIGTANQIKNWLGGNGGAAAGYDYHGAVEDIRQKVYNVEALLSPGGAIRNGIDWQNGAIYDEARLSTPATYTLNGYGYLVTSRTIHRISVGTIPPEVGQIDFTGDNVWLPRFGWWAPITAQGAVLERHYIDWKEQWLVPAPQTCVGLAYHLPTGVNATLYAYSVL